MYARKRITQCFLLHFGLIFFYKSMSGNTLLFFMFCIDGVPTPYCSRCSFSMMVK